MSAPLTADQHRARGTPYHRKPEPAPPAPSPPTAPEPLEPLGPAGARLYAWAWQTWAAVLTPADVATLTNLAQLADQAADMDALYASAPEAKRAMAGRLRVSARLRLTQELARVTALAEKALEA